jgi:LysM repeat protein
MTKTCNVKNLSQILITLLFCSTLIAQEKPNASVAYIEQYKDIAISEMDRTGIPASIKLAQGLVESGAGQSTLSREANNHFGIKCNGGWTGPTHYRKDDDYKNGKLIKSCFRKFGSPHESYIAHSDFLTTQRRYSSLFELAHIDYYSWAHGLKKAGYATDPKYAHKLIDVIEKYQLFRYDDKEAVIIADEGSKRKSQSTHNNKRTQTDPTPPATVLASAEKKSRSNRSSKRKNSVRHFSKARLASAKTHRVAEGESLASIAKAYELEETSLRLRNRIPRDAQPLPGEKINLRKKISILKRPKFTRVPEEGVLASADDYLF